MATGGHLSNAGGSGGSGAGGTSGGAAGAGGSHLGGAAGSPASGGGGGDDTCGCVVPELVWGPNGGLVAYAETSELSCDTFSLTVTPTQTDPPSEACTTIITSCENMVSPAELQTAVEHPDVQAALLAAPVLYGADTRVLDVPVLRITVDGARIEVGAECSDCEGIPEGVSVFAELLEQLTREQRMTSECNF